MTPFDRLDRIASRSVDWLNAEDVELIPMAGRPNDRTAVDPNRPSISARGVFDQRSAPIGLQLGDRRQNSKANDFRAIVNGRHFEMSIDRVVYFPSPEDLPRQGDHVIARGRRFTVTSVRPDGAARVVLNLEEIA
jgi:hypothetical protein